MKYSIITPNYNGFSLMANYFESLENQTYKDFEVIIVDDCSTDDSYEKLIEYANNSKLDIKVYKAEKNAGPGNARNIGMENASGEWITFIDNDDWVENSFLKEIDDVILKNDVNCVIYDYFIKNDKRTTISRSMYDGEMGIVTLSDCLINARNHSIGKFYKLSCCKMKDIKFPSNLRRCEDVAFVVRAIEACGSVYYYKKPLYYYYQRSTSLSNNKMMDESDMINAFSVIEKSLGNQYSIEIQNKSISDLLYGSLLMMCKANKSNEEIDVFIDSYENKYPAWCNSNIINNLGKFKKLFLMFVPKKNVFMMKLLAYVHDILIRI